MSYSEAHIIYVFQSPKHCLLTEETRLWWFWQSCAPDPRVVDFDHHLDDENPVENIDETYLCGQRGPTTAPIGIQSKNLTTHQLICAQVVLQKQLCSPVCSVLSRQFPENCRLGKPFSAVRDVIWIARGNSIIVGRSITRRGTAQPNTS